MLHYLEFLNENEKEKLDLLAVDMIDYYGNELPVSSDKAEDFAKSREINDKSMIKKIWNRAKEIQKDGLDEGVYGSLKIPKERIDAYEAKYEDLKKKGAAAIKKYEKLMNAKSSNQDEIDSAYDEMMDALEKFMDHRRSAP